MESLYKERTHCLISPKQSSNVPTLQFKDVLQKEKGRQAMQYCKDRKTREACFYPPWKETKKSVHWEIKYIYIYIIKLYGGRVSRGVKIVY